MLNEGGGPSVAFMKVYVEHMDQGEMQRLKDEIFRVWDGQRSKEKGFFAKIFKRSYGLGAVFFVPGVMQWEGEYGVK